MTDVIYDLAIIGAGPAGTAAAVYAARKQLKTAMIFFEWGGQSNVSADVQNWIGIPHLPGNEMSQRFKEHVEEYRGEFVDIFDFDKVEKISKDEGVFSLTTEAGKTIKSRSILVAVGSTRRKLEVPGADNLEHRGVTYCASCDGPFFAGQEVVVVGGGNAGFESAAQLLAYCPKVTLLNRSMAYRADPSTVEKVLSHPNMRGVTNIDFIKVEGEEVATGITIKHKETGEIETIPAGAIFIEIGLIPSTGFLGDLVAKNDMGQIMIDPRTQKTGTPGVWAAGDCTDVLYHQNNIAAGDAVRALEDIYVSLRA